MKLLNKPPSYTDFQELFHKIIIFGGPKIEIYGNILQKYFGELFIPYSYFNPMEHIGKISDENKVKLYFEIKNKLIRK